MIEVSVAVGTWVLVLLTFVLVMQTWALLRRTNQ